MEPIIISELEISNEVKTETLDRILRTFGEEFLLVQDIKNSLVISEYHVKHSFELLSLREGKHIWAKANLDDLKNKSYLSSLSEMKLDNQYTRAIHDIGVKGQGYLSFNIGNLKTKWFPQLKWFNWITFNPVGFNENEINVLVHNKESLGTDSQLDGNLTFSATWVAVMGEAFWRHLVGHTDAELERGLKHVSEMYENACRQPEPVVEEVQESEPSTPAMEVYTIEEIKKVFDFLGVNHSIEDFETALGLVVKQRK